MLHVAVLYTVFCFPQSNLNATSYSVREFLLATCEKTSKWSFS